MQGAARKFRYLIALFSEVVGEPLAREWPPVLIENERSGSALPCCDLGVQFRQDRTPRPHVGFDLPAPSEIEADAIIATVDHGRTEPNHIAAALASVVEQQEASAHVAGKF